MRSTTGVKVIGAGVHIYIYIYSILHILTIVFPDTHNVEYIHFFPCSSATILLVWSANGDAPFQGKFQVNLLNDERYLSMELCDIILRTNRVRCALNMEILDLLNDESISGAHSGRASL